MKSRRDVTTDDNCRKSTTDGCVRNSDEDYIRDESCLSDDRTMRVGQHSEEGSIRSNPMWDPSPNSMRESMPMTGPNSTTMKAPSSTTTMGHSSSSTARGYNMNSTTTKDGPSNTGYSCSNCNMMESPNNSQGYRDICLYWWSQALSNNIAQV